MQNALVIWVIIYEEKVRDREMLTLKTDDLIAIIK